MALKQSLILAAALLPVAESAASPLPVVVAVRYTVGEQSPERVEATVTNPLERVLASAPRLSAMNSTTGHGVVDFELHFEGGATKQDLAAAIARIDGVALARDVVVTSRTARLAVQRLSNDPAFPPPRPDTADASGAPPIPASRPPN